MKDRLIYEAKNFSVRSGTFMNQESREERELIYIRQPSVAVAIPKLSDGRIVLVQQWRPLVGSVLVECPGGKVDDGETPEEALHRELSEEIGLAPTNMQKLGDYYSSVGASTEHIYLFVASNLSSVERRVKDVKEIKLVYYTENDIKNILREGKFSDGKTQLAFYAYFANLGKD
jgi:ADP-ribose pyrophosphatase